MAALSSVSSTLLLVLLTLALVKVDACTCATEDLLRRYYFNQQQGTPFTVATVQSSGVTPSSPARPGDQFDPFDGPLPPFNQNRIFKLRIRKVFANCAPPVPYLATAISSTQGSLCGIDLQKGETYLIPLKPGSGVQSRISLCSNIMPIRNLPRDFAMFLNDRQLCCKGLCKCVNKMSPSICPGAKCRVAKPPCPGAVRCVENPCKRCFPEWFDNRDLPACRPVNFPW